MDIIAGSDNSPQVNAVRSRRGPQSYRSFSQNKSEDGKKQFHPQKKSSHKPCHKCGDEHTKGSCPAKYATCYFCKKIGHYTKVCQDDSSDDMNAYNLGEIGTITTKMKSVNNVSAKTTHNKDRSTRSTRGSSPTAVMTSNWKSTSQIIAYWTSTEAVRPKTMAAQDWRSASWTNLQLQTSR